MALTTDGKVLRREDHPDAIVSWPGCPRQWAGARHWGQDVITLADCLRWEVDRGTHRRSDISAGAARLLREYIVLSEWPSRIAEARAARKAKEKAGR